MLYVPKFFPDNSQKKPVSGIFFSEFPELEAQGINPDDADVTFGNGETVDDILQLLIQKKVLREKPDGLYEFTKPSSYYGALASTVMAEVRKRPETMKEILSFSNIHRVDLKNKLKKNPIALDLGFSFLIEKSVSQLITFVSLYLFTISEEYQDFLYYICKKTFRNVYRECQGFTGKYLDFFAFKDIAIGSRMPFTKWGENFAERELIYHYFFEHMNIETASAFVLVPIYFSCESLSVIEALSQGKLPERIPATSRRQISRLKDTLPKFEIPQSILESYSHMNLSMNAANSETYMLAAYSLFESQEMSSKNAEERAQYTLSFISALNTWKSSLVQGVNDFFDGFFVMSIEKEVEKIVEVPSNVNRTLETKNRELTKKLQQMEKKSAHEQSVNIRKIEKLNAELEGLKELLSMHEEADVINEEMENTEEKPSFEEMVSYLNQYKCIIVGGHDHWIKQMQDLFPKWCCYDTASPSQLLQGKQTCDAMIFFTKHIGHPLFYKFMNLCKAKNIPHCALNHANIEKAVQQIYLMVKKKTEKK